MAIVHLVIFLSTRDSDLVGVHDNDVVARIDVRGIRRLVLSAQTFCDFRSQSTKRVVRCVDDVPIVYHILWSCTDGAYACQDDRPTLMKPQMLRKRIVDNNKILRSCRGGIT